MTVEIGTEAALFPEKEYINGIFVAEWATETLEKVGGGEGEGGGVTVVNAMTGPDTRGVTYGVSAQATTHILSTA
jgi:hypothetical protein